MEKGLFGHRLFPQGLGLTEHGAISLGRVGSGSDPLRFAEALLPGQGLHRRGAGESGKPLQGLPFLGCGPRKDGQR
jgi:hypothetical protein